VATSVTHLLDFVCEGYVGNFEVEFASYVFNFPPEYDNRDFSIYLTEKEREAIEQELDEDFLEGFYTEYGWRFVELGYGKRPGTDEQLFTVQVHVSDEIWKTVTPELIENLKIRAVKFFEVYEANLPTYRTSDGAFVGLVHTTIESTSTKELL